MNADDLIKLFDTDSSIADFDSNKVDLFLDSLSKLLMYEYYKPEYDKKDINELIEIVSCQLNDVLSDYEKTILFLNSLPEIRRTLNTSIEAILDGDPASFNKQEIVLMYPGFEAILDYRIAHQFYLMGYHMVARYISEKAHHHTGIDINPGASIGDYFFIDHGTGIVIGETTVIGHHVKLYQGVTLGALSLSKGRCLLGKKRHPTVEDNVTIYSNAAIFGGDTIIHKGSIIGGDVYLTHSVDENSIVLQTDKDLTIIKKKTI